MKKSIILTLSILTFIPVTLQAQMFSVGEAEERQPLRIQSYSTIALGVEFADFEFTGGDVAAEDQAEFNGNILRVRVENPGLNISAGFGGKLTGS